MMDFFKNPKISRIFDIGQSIILLFIAILVSINLIMLRNKVSFTNTSSANDNILVKTNNQMDEGTTKNEQDKENLAEDKLSEEKSTSPIYVDIKGAIKKPGVYKVDSKAIVNDIITLAGGLKTNASTKYLNLSKKVSNEMVINVYTTNDINKMNEPPKTVCDCSQIDISECTNASIIESTNSTSSSDKSSTSSNKKPSTNQASNTNTTSSPISINTATLEELMTLSGIGESKAQAIIEYRQKNGQFKSLEELMNVSGIGASAFEKIKDHIKL